MGGLFLIGDDVVSTLPDFSTFISTLQGSITPAQLLTVLGSVVGVGITFVLMWFGVRKISSAFVSAVMNGKLKVR